MKKTTKISAAVFSLILAIGLLSSCNSTSPKANIAEPNEPVEMVTAEIPEKPEEPEPQEIERASFSNGNYTVTVEDKELIYSVKEIVDDIIANCVVIDEADIQYYKVGLPDIGFSGIAYVDNGNTVKVSWNMTFKTDCEYNVDGNEVIKINAEYYVVSSDTYDELMSLYKQGRATEDEEEPELQEIEKASFDYRENVITIEDKDTIYYVKNLVDSLLADGERINTDEYHIDVGDTCGGENSITYVDNGKTVRIKWDFRVGDSERYGLKINSEYYWLDYEDYVDLVSLFKISYPCENEAERWHMEFTDGDEVFEISDKEIVSRAEAIYTTLFYELIDGKNIEIRQDENAEPQGVRFIYGDGVTKTIEWNFYDPTSDKYNDRVIFRETYTFENREEDSVHYLAVLPKHYEMLKELYEKGISQ